MRDDRVLDANVNRAAEGLRVLEDLARFKFNDSALSLITREVRHELRDTFKGREVVFLAGRDVEGDVGQDISQKMKSDERTSLIDVVSANSKRAQEAFRVLEELLKNKGIYTAGKKIEKLRYRAYSLEAKLMDLCRKKLPEGIYGILGEKFSLGRSNIEVAKELVAGGIDVLQYREKLSSKSFREILEDCREIRKITADGGVPFIVNDFVEIAVMVGADGIHQGQDDLPIEVVKKHAPEMLLGCSTHSPLQAKEAIRNGADYIGVGPIFTTQTKEDVCDPVGFEYLDHVVENHSIDFVAIGGIKRNNLEQVVRRGATTVCLVTEIIGADNIQDRLQEIREIIEKSI